jgi:uncharacterized protein
VKYLIVLVAVAVGLWLLFGRASRRGSVGSGRSGRSGRPAADAEAMIACAHCGVHLPRGDAVADGALIYCSEAHRIAGPAAK